MGKFKLGEKAKIKRNVYTVDGTLYLGDVVTIDEIEEKSSKVRVKDGVGKIWYLNEWNDLNKIEDE